MNHLALDTPVAQSAQVTLDVLHSGVIWGWYVTMNFWAKSIGTGVLLVGPFMLKRFSSNAQFYRLWMPLLAFAFISITLLFTVLDLHQMFRFWHLFIWPQWGSAITLGAWALSGYMGLLTLMLYAAWKKNDTLHDRLILPTVVLAFCSTIYTAGLLGQSTAREVWSTATELPQMILAATLAGSAVFLLFKSPGEEERRIFAWVLGLSAFFMAAIFVVEVIYAPAKSEEGAYVIHVLTSGGIGTLFYAGMFLGFVVPAFITLFGLKAGWTRLLPVAAASSLVGLWMVKHAWLIAPQLMPLS